MSNRKRRRRKKKQNNVVWTVILIAQLTAIFGVAAYIIIKLFGVSNADVQQVEAPNGSQETAALNNETVIMEMQEVINSDEPQMLLQYAGTTSIHLAWNPTSNAGYEVVYRALSNSNGEHHGKNMTEDGTTSMGNICSAVYEGEDDGGIQDEAHGWIRKTTRDSSMVITGLSPNVTYQVHVLYGNSSMGEYLPMFELTTSNYGYGDPFKAIDSFITVSERDPDSGVIIQKGETVCVEMSSPNGCLGVSAKPIMDTTLYEVCTLESQAYNIAKGTSLVVTQDELGYYCYRTYNGVWTLHVQANGGYSGWVDARTLMIDVKGLFNAANPIYGIQIDRTNAYSSIFTAGGNAKAVDLTSDTSTRYAPLNNGNNKNSFLNTAGYNGIDRITATALPNYGSQDQMPVIWDLAVELIQCQKTALENGYTILMYEGYRPLSTSTAVSSELSNQGYLTHGAGGTNFAQGWLTGHTYTVGYYIATKSRHNRGIATDLTIMRFDSVTKLGQEAEMQTKMHTLDFRCNMQYNTWEADLLTDIMIGHGSHLEYLSYRQEWWHFQLKTERTDLYPLIDQYDYVDFIF